MNKLPLMGDWSLTYWDQQLDPEGTRAKAIPARVPGNVELDLMRAGELPDVFLGTNIKLLRDYEFCAWRYELRFNTPDIPIGHSARLRFEGVDCVAEYRLNGVLIGESANALVPHVFDITGAMAAGENLLSVTLFSPILHAAGIEQDASETAMYVNYESLNIRKAPSQYGWDIMPRAVSAGLWRGVYIEILSPNEIEDVYLATLDCDKTRARIACAYRAHTDAGHYRGLSLKITGSIGGREEFTVERDITFPSGRFVFDIDSPKLWMPRGYGEANVYDINVSLRVDGHEVASHETTLGIRTVKLIRSEVLTGAGDGDFHFEINHVKVFCKGSNWVPADAFHSRDAGRYADMLALFTDTNCNMLRCWGGNVYEDHEFFDICDRYGIMVWQDFAMACGNYPRGERFLGEIGEEAESVIKKLRNHPSIVLWSGDNECDQFAVDGSAGYDPADNRATREVLPRMVKRHDPYRPYLPSSPYISPEAYESGGELNALLPENHLWGPRDYFKGQFYTSSPARFVSEMGYHGCNSISSIKSFISPDKLWPWRENDEWLAHASEHIGPDGAYAYRIKLMADQIEELFGRQMDNLTDFVLASQISQAEAKKFFIETARAMRWKRSGILWWNMIDGWPQFSDAVVSYDYIKKLAYHYIKRAQADVCLMFSEPDGWHIKLIAANDTLEDASGGYRVWDSDSGATLLEGRYLAPANQSSEVARLRVSHGHQRLLMMEWETNGARQVNHYMLGKPPLPYEKYKEKWLYDIAALDGSFAAEEVGK